MFLTFQIWHYYTRNKTSEKTKNRTINKIVDQNIILSKPLFFVVSKSSTFLIPTIELPKFFTFPDCIYIRIINRIDTTNKSIAIASIK